MQSMNKATYATIFEFLLMPVSGGAKQIPFSLLNNKLPKDSSNKTHEGNLFAVVYPFSSLRDLLLNSNYQHYVKHRSPFHTIRPKLAPPQAAGAMTHRPQGERWCVERQQLRASNQPAWLLTWWCLSNLSLKMKKTVNITIWYTSNTTQLHSKPTEQNQLIAYMIEC